MQPHYFDLGAHSHTITTTSPEAQLWFDRGLIWCYGFNHEEAVRCFQKAVAADDGCAMGWWGIAHASGANYNRTYEAFEPDDLRIAFATAHYATGKALARLAGTSPVEQALILASQARFPRPVVEDEPGFWRWIEDYVVALRPVHAAFPNDHDVCALFAEALINRTPWTLWDLRTGQPTEGAHTLEAVQVAENAMAQADRDGLPQNPGVLHVYVHTMEMSPYPERALRAADGLRDYAPDSGHLQHMPSHIDILCGDYQAGMMANHKAIIADRAYVLREGMMNLYTTYRVHDLHFKTYAAMFLGQFQPALQAAQEIILNLPESYLRMSGGAMADWAEAFVPMQFHVLVRFGRWEQILSLPFPADKNLYAFTTALQHYARGVAHAVLGELAAARIEQLLFIQAAARVPDSRTLFTNSCADLLAIAREMLSGEVEYRAASFEAAFAHLHESVRLDESLPYDEPWGWMQPPRHALGALLLEQNRIAEAAAVYRADLGFDPTTPRPSRHPDNVWSLHGYVECLNKLGRPDEVALFQPRLDLALARADAGIGASCFCRGRSVCACD